MDQSQLLMSAEIHFIETTLKIVHIPLQSYSHYLSTVLQLLFPSQAYPCEDPRNQQWQFSHFFLNVSITPLECCVVCESNLATTLFAPVQDSAIQSGRDASQDYGSISSEDFMAMSVQGAGMEAGQRVLEVTSPIARAGISIFFITTYTNDYVLFPRKARAQVIRALEDRNFTFEKSSRSYTNPSSHYRHLSSESEPTSPSTPPPATLRELQNQTFSQLLKHQVTPHFDKGIQLVQCASRTENPETSVADNLALQHGITRCLIHQPKFLSVTMTKAQPASLLLEKRLVSNFDMAGDWENTLLGAKDDILIPVVLNLASLGMDASGIVCGVAAKLVEGPGVIDLSYLSTANAGVVIVNANDLDDVMHALRFGTLEEPRDSNTRFKPSG